MAFGAELKDFVAGFQAGYQMIDSPEDREWKRKERQMRMEDHSNKSKWREEDRAYQRERDSTSDSRWEKQFEREGENIQFNKERTARDDAFRTEDLRLKEEELEQRRKALRLKREVDPNYRAPVDMDDWWERERQRENPQENQTPIPDPENQSAIPDDSVNQTAMQNGFQPASYAESATDNTGFDLRNYLASIRSAESGGNDMAANPRSTARGRYQFLRSTWNGLANKYPELELTRSGRFDPDQQERAIRRFTYDNAKYLDRRGIPITNGTLYAAHFLGADGARKVLSSDPSESVARIVGRDVVRANPFLSDMSVSEFERWAEKKGNKIKPRREEEVIAMASGGVVPDNLEDQMAVAEDATMQYQMSLPEEPEEEETEGAIPVPRPRPDYEGTTEGEEPTDDIWELARRSVRDGLKRSIEEAGMNNPDGAIEDEADAKAQEYYLNGYGAAPGQLMKQVIDKIDPDHQMPPAERNMKAMGYVYRFYMDQGKPEEAKAAAASMVQYYRAASSRFLALSQAAAEEGDIDNAAQAAIAAYANIPNGRDLDIQVNRDADGNATSMDVTVTDAKTGKKINRTVMRPQEFAAAAMQFTPTTFDDEILNAAEYDPEKLTDASPEDISKVSEDLQMQAQEKFADMAPERLGPLVDSAASIAALKENGMTASEALRFVDPNDVSRFKAKPVRGNPDLIEVTKENGMTAIMRKNAFVAWQGIRKSFAEEKIAAEKAAKEPGVIEKVTDLTKNTVGPLIEDNAAAEEQTRGKETIDAENALVRERDEILAMPESRRASKRFRLKTIEDELRKSGYLHSEEPAADQGAIPEEPVKRAPAQTTAIPDEDTQGPNLPRPIQALFDTRARILALHDPEEYRAELDNIESQLRELGYLK